MGEEDGCLEMFGIRGRKVELKVVEPDSAQLASLLRGPPKLA
jgi:hypothetical protein